MCILCKSGDHKLEHIEEYISNLGSSAKKVAERHIQKLISNYEWILVGNGYEGWAKDSVRSSLVYLRQIQEILEKYGSRD